MKKLQKLQKYINTKTQKYKKLAKNHNKKDTKKIQNKYKTNTKQIYLNSYIYLIMNKNWQLSHIQCN
jgi:hypothetical protein